ncbi:MAG TPA: hypothetical protein PKK55_02805 [Methanofastidiosum sp.]|nr:hypothetical protein [Methanofastidiosum sp.]HOC78034.1 hypothetical protein [Methanofastidiosum sp.]HPA49337.1 hypothetical protein [Methanofastidiosum sp.]HQQ49421.1 hypothetical protein [Methanofastidiosum sp.]
MKKIAIVFALVLFLATVSMASAAPTKVVNVRQVCRTGDIIVYGMFNANDGSIFDSIEAQGYLDLIEKINAYEKDNGINLLWNYDNSKARIGNEVRQC